MKHLTDEQIESEISVWSEIAQNRHKRGQSAKFEKSVLAELMAEKQERAKA